MLENLDRLKIFYFVYHEKSIAGASERLYVSPSAVSQSIQKLEEELKTPLFTRLHKKIIPTDAGTRLFKLVESFMSELNIYLEDLAHSKETPSGELRIGSPPEFGKVYLSMMAAEFRKRYPEVTFKFEFGTPDILLPLLREGRIDFILLDDFLTKKPYDGNLHIFDFKPVTKEKIILACSDEYYEKHIKDDLSFETLIKQRYISYTDDRMLISRWFKHHFSKQSVKINCVMTVNDHEAVVSGILNHIGVGIISSHLVKNELESGKMIKITTPEPDIVNTISLVQLLDKVPTLSEKLFSKFLISKIKSILTDYENDC